jgi:hypothetical protein
MQSGILEYGALGRSEDLHLPLPTEMKDQMWLRGSALVSDQFNYGGCLADLGACE